MSTSIKSTAVMNDFISSDLFTRLRADTEARRMAFLRDSMEVPFNGHETRPQLPQDVAQQMPTSVQRPAASAAGAESFAEDDMKEVEQAEDEKPAEVKKSSPLHPAGRSRSVFGSNQQMLSAGSAKSEKASAKAADALPAESKEDEEDEMPAESAESAKSQKKEMPAESAESKEAELKEEAEGSAESEESILKELRQSADWNKHFGISEARGLIYIKDGEVSRFRTLADFKLKMGSRIDGKKFPTVGSSIDWRGGKLISTKSRK